MCLFSPWIWKLLRDVNIEYFTFLCYIYALILSFNVFFQAVFFKLKLCFQCFVLIFFWILQDSFFHVCVLLDSQFPGGGTGNLLLPGEPYGQRSLEGYTVHGVTKSPTRLTNTQTLNYHLCHFNYEETDDRNFKKIAQSQIEQASELGSILKLTEVWTKQDKDNHISTFTLGVSQGQELCLTNLKSVHFTTSLTYPNLMALRQHQNEQKPHHFWISKLHLLSIYYYSVFPKMPSANVLIVLAPDPLSWFNLGYICLYLSLRKNVNL